MTTLTTSTGATFTANPGESIDVVANFHDLDGTAINKASLITLTFRLEDPDGNVINSQSGSVSIIDANGGTVETDGTVRMRLQPLDNISYQGRVTTVNRAIFTYTWSDGVETRTGVTTCLITVKDAVSDLTDSDGDKLFVDAGESMNITGTLKNTRGTQLAKAQIATLTGQLYEKDNLSVIRSSQSIKDANNGTVATDGTMTWRLGAADSAMTGSLDTEVHVAKITFTYSDTTALPSAMTRTGISLYSFTVVAN